MRELIVQTKFWNGPYRVVQHDESDNTIHVNSQVFPWEYFFQVNKIVD